ncbi:glycosyltransferase family 2 protein [Cuniculiplasma divulgatum]|uniref:Family 2 glycosyl transferase n=1 Tax=Cuniculiplasma divulgatum TaxID=1673428 RepID=A0A1R4A789_9ARCH|nr:glycosyltransferase [Cuniculiplasma divulgatum]MCI2411905.1 glycosyltransferase [Cuniculiplasma sp.]SJK84812.1 family 2 glycosyl transferase [Cuniculiplasma divulgatum]
MKISVIIPAYKRKNFVLDAVNSVLKNDTKSNFEILVVKNFHDTAIENELIKNGVNVIDSMDETLGGKIVEAFHKSDGDVVSILEDDDRFATYKLMEIEKSFQNKNLGFFHNSTSCIDYDGRTVKSDKDRKKVLYISDRKKEENLRQIHQYKGYYNTSSMTVRREIIMDIVPYMEKIKLNVDLLLLLGALKSSYDLFFTPMKLTEYRKHDSTSNRRNTSFSDFLKNNYEFVNTLFEDSFVYTDMMKNSRFYNYTMAWVKFIEMSKVLFSNTKPLHFEKSIEEDYDWVPFGKVKNKMINLTLKSSPLIRKIVLESLYVTGYSISP